jgi:hypothetical protein
VKPQKTTKGEMVGKKKKKNAGGATPKLGVPSPFQGGRSLGGPCEL